MAGGLISKLDGCDKRSELRKNELLFHFHGLVVTKKHEA
jgi:hypothetical protein